MNIFDFDKYKNVLFFMENYFKKKSEKTFKNII